MRTIRVLAASVAALSLAALPAAGAQASGHHHKAPAIKAKVYRGTTAQNFTERQGICCSIGVQVAKSRKLVKAAFQFTCPDGVRKGVTGLQNLPLDRRGRFGGGAHSAVGFADGTSGEAVVAITGAFKKGRFTGLLRVRLTDGSCDTGSVRWGAF